MAEYCVAVTVKLHNRYKEHLRKPAIHIPPAMPGTEKWLRMVCV